MAHRYNKMTITVTVEELRAHEAACIQWAVKRSEFYGRQHVLVTDQSTFSSRIEPRAGFLAAMEHWDRENPAPRLIPAV